MIAVIFSIRDEDLSRTRSVPDRRSAPRARADCDSDTVPYTCLHYNNIIIIQYGSMIHMFLIVSFIVSLELW